MLDMCTMDNRKAHIDRHNRLIQKNLRTPESSLMGSSLFSHDISLNSCKTELDDRRDTTAFHFTHSSRRPSQVLHESLTSHVSEKDRKILHLMALRRENKMEESEAAMLARSFWEEEKAQQARRVERNKTYLTELLAKKKEMEELENAIRRNNLDESFKQEKKILEMKISKKHERVERRQKELCLQKKLKPKTMTTKHQLLLHQELKKQREEEEEMEKALHVQQFRVKERRSEEKLACVLMERSRKLREERTKQELRWEAAKNVREELERRWREERMREMRFSERNELIRKERVRWTKEWRRKIVSEKNERERQQHAVTYNKVKEEEKEKLNRTRRKMQAKDMKAKAFMEKREEAISRSRSNARTTAELRQKIRLTYNL